jgi:hypothetical protein
MFSGTQPRQDVKNLRRFRDCPRPHLQVVGDGLVQPKLTKSYQLCSTESSVTTCKWGRSQLLKLPRNFTFCRGCVPENISLRTGVVFIKFRGENLKHICVAPKIMLYILQIYTCIFISSFDICRRFYEYNKFVI